MCGILFVSQNNKREISKEKFETALSRQNWRGPDARQVSVYEEGRFLLGHNRLAIIDLDFRSNQPMVSRSGHLEIIFNGEIYNHLEIRKKIGLKCATTSDTETILEGYAVVGEKIFQMLDGMFALIIFDKKKGSWLAARDPFGIKPLFIGYSSLGTTVVGSEAAVVGQLINASRCELALAEWRLIRGPLPGKTYFNGVSEILPGMITRHDGSSLRFWTLSRSDLPYEQEVFESILTESVKQHELSDVTNVSLLSGGLDSAVITALSSVSKCYSIGTSLNNEFSGAQDSATFLNKGLINVTVTPERLVDTWRQLVYLRGEPLSVPNEVLIYLVCSAMGCNEKVVLTGEGADELVFGYDKIFRWASCDNWNGTNSFLLKYGYSDNTKPTKRLIEYIEELRFNKTNIEFIEDFFYHLHLPLLLRRIDFASMAASKEARVPFVNKRLVSYMYRRPWELKINSLEAKLPLRHLAKKLGLVGALNRKKIGFSAEYSNKKSKYVEYQEFQNVVLKALKW
jgi:asparagine synthase (glutamine-hydrolysing)